MLALLFTVLNNTYSQSYKIIVNTNNSVNSLTKKEASNFFLKTKTKWENGTIVMPVDLTAGSKTRDAFSQDILAKSTSAVRNYWQQAAFSGTATAPPEKSSDAEVIEYIKKNPGGIGYVSSGASTEGVKVLTIN